ncbi:hypothetical protein Taro_034107 [Colocasia esculenta]|uniref:Uncharacterized protein n=1 Tax=Colocasia esculenta TaxID=4460 RepID=A0A843WAZ1_COLES|nr:hypothetical protein [Colocasia esculenta]
MGVDDGVFVPPLDTTQHGNYIDVRNGVFMPLFDIYRMVFVPLSDNIASTCVVSLTTEDLNEDAGSYVTTCGDFARTRRRKARTRRTEHQRQPETSSLALADQSSELRGSNRPGKRG